MKTFEVVWPGWLKKLSGSTQEKKSHRFVSRIGSRGSCGVVTGEFGVYDQSESREWRH